MWNLRDDTKKPIYETEIESETQRIDWCLPKGREWERVGLGVWDQNMQTDIYRTDKQQSPTVQHR